MTTNMDGNSLDLRREQLERLKSLFPEAVSEGRIDFDRLRQTLGDDVIPLGERYVLNWAGKSEAFKAIQTPTTATLKAQKKESVDFDTTQNIFIEGENLEVLKVLQKSYYGKVKMIYIDPPYNTGNDSFIYPDKFAESKEEYLKRVGDKDEEGYLTKEGLFRKNSKENGQFHSNWLSMMYPRLFLARNLLRDDGVIFVSIDDNEVHNLRLMMNEIFGEENFVAQMVWEGAGKNDARQIGTNHEYVLVFARYAQVQPREWTLAKNGVAAVLKEVERLRTEYGEDFESASSAMAAWYRANKATPAFANRRFRYIDKNGVYKEDDPTAAGGRKFNLIDPRTGQVIPLRANRGWAFDQERFDQMVKDGRISFVSDTSVMVRRYLHETDRLTPQSVFYQPARSASERLADLLGPGIFEFPKDERVIGQFIEMTTTLSEPETIILDFFAGSGTTGHAVMELNKETRSNRKYILVQLPERIEEHTEANKLGYKTIADIGKERIRRVSKKIKDETEQNPDLFTEKKLDLGFKSFVLEQSNFKVWLTDAIKNEDELKRQIEAFQDPVKKKSEAEAMAWEILIKSGYELTTPLERIEIADAPVYSIANGEVMFALEKISQKTIDAVIAKKPKRVICLDSLFARQTDGGQAGNDQLKTNTALQMKDAGIEFRTI